MCEFSNMRLFRYLRAESSLCLQFFREKSSLEICILHAHNNCISKTLKLLYCCSESFYVSSIQFSFHLCKCTSFEYSCHPTLAILGRNDQKEVKQTTNELCIELVQSLNQNSCTLLHHESHFYSI